MSNYSLEKFSKILNNEIAREQKKLDSLLNFKYVQIEQAQTIKLIDSNFDFGIGELFFALERKPRDEKYFQTHFKSLPLNYEKRLFRCRNSTKKYCLTSSRHQEMTDFFIYYRYIYSEYQYFYFLPYFIKNNLHFFDSSFLSLQYRSFECASRTPAHQQTNRQSILESINNLSQNNLNPNLKNQILNFCSQCQQQNNEFLSSFERCE